MSAFLTPENFKIANEIYEWINNYIVKENPNIKRPSGNQTVCPFVAPSLENDSLYMAFHPEINGDDVSAIEEIMYSYIHKFHNLKPFQPNKQVLKALLVIFPKITQENFNVLDFVHKEIKPKFVKEHLMVGQFHPKCTEKAVYNPTFLVSVAPYPLIAIRHMAKHDILFLGNDEQNFHVFNLKFGDDFKNPEKLEDFEKPLLKYYQEAKTRFLK